MCRSGTDYNNERLMSLSGQDHAPACLHLSGLHHVCAYVERSRHIRVPHQLHECPVVDTCREHDCCERVPHCVEADARESRQVGETLELAGDAGRRLGVEACLWTSVFGAGAPARLTRSGVASTALISMEGLMNAAEIATVVEGWATLAGLMVIVAGAVFAGVPLRQEAQGQTSAGVGRPIRGTSGPSKPNYPLSEL